MNDQPKIYIIPVSCKGIVFEDERVWLRKNERNEWEIPGGKEDVGEQPEETVVREIKEELGLETTIIDIVDAYMFQINKSTDETKGVLVLSYLCKIVKRVGMFELVSEGGNAKFERFSMEEMRSLNMPDFYKQAIEKAWRVRNNNQNG